MNTNLIPPTGFRIHPELKDALKAQAKRNGRSLNSEVIQRLEKSISDEQKEKAPNA